MASRVMRLKRSVLYLTLTDYLIILGTFGVALRFRLYNFGMNIVDVEHGQVVPPAAFMFLYAALALTVFSSLGLYKRKIWLNQTWHAVQILKGTAILVGVYFLLRGMIKAPWILESRYVLMNWSLLLFAILLFHRCIFFPRLMRLAARSALQRRVVLVGDSQAAAEFVKKWRVNPSDSMINIVGQASYIPLTQRLVKDLPDLGSPDNLADLVAEYQIEGAVIIPSDLGYPRLMSTIELCVTLFGWVDVHSNQSMALNRDVDADAYFEIPFARFEHTRTDPLFLMGKELFDLVAATLGVLVLSPVFIAVALAVKLTSPGPVFYVRERVGLNGKTFPFFKFRSMAVGAEKDASRQSALEEHIKDGNAAVAKIINTSYVTPVGRFIRKWALDEMPQLFNVIRGDMSLVGPRPIPPSEFNLNEEWQKTRFNIKPGCTGLWKLRAAREDISYNEIALYDIYYARNMSFLLDFYILLNTVRVVLGGRADA